MGRRNGPALEERLRQTTLYQPELDLSVGVLSGDVAGYALLWFDPVTLVGMLEPMRIEDPFRRRGLARALIGAGLDPLVGKGATHLKVSFSTGAARNVYTGVGFRPALTTSAYVRAGRPA
jgi:GNAT superfamily N-acetyltransferase